MNLVHLSTPRARLIRAALEEFSDGGYADASLVAIADRAGLGVDVLAEHFADKRALLSAALSRRDRTVRDEVWAGAKGEGWNGIQAWVELMRNNQKKPGTVRFFAELRLLATDPQHPAHDWLRGHFELVDEVVERAVSTGITRGEIRPDTDAAALARGLLAMIEGIETRWLATPAEVDPVAMISDYVDLLAGVITTDAFRARLRR
ncbi:TetR/AcrR family transcriptional regulator [Galactobacter valiniphilus]|uniref:TetR/AcrR family transcriptional regulator n=1 Tax=Galactobacter valiniphilus TaxID=2676122 RepID=UPI001314456F|nr:TetR/AcrR family transcriptional regulator [Galactobacter valiniphilus]